MTARMHSTPQGPYKVNIKYKCDVGQYVGKYGKYDTHTVALRVKYGSRSVNAVLEHLEEPAELVRFIQGSLLSENGFVVGSIPVQHTYSIAHLQ
eukprot:2245768-Pyramimonas_sp.AAC.1